ncbi:MAG: DUF4861 domain-containing protein [Bacteroidales bacterium]|nr:DUF4861 domain-containing protein [Bacteroidales bacterium]
MKTTYFFILSFLCSFYSDAADQVKIIISNPLTTSRLEVVEIPFQEIVKRLGGRESFMITDANGNEVQQQRTYDGKFLFQAGVGDKGRSVYYAKIGVCCVKEDRVYGRLFTERQDEIGWENDRVAYRIYGHGAAVGYDVFNKSTSDLMLNHWYASEQNQEMRSVCQQLREKGLGDLAEQVYLAYSYHVDHGKGMDCYTVGPTLGGGANALVQEDGSLFMPQCYESFEILDEGPLRFTIRLTYPAQTYQGERVVETRTISLDAGSHFNRVTVSYQGLGATSHMAAGVVVHKNNPAAYVLSPDHGYLGYEDLGDASVYPERYREGLSRQMGKIYVGLLFPSNEIEMVFQERENGMAIGHLLAKSSVRPSSALTYYFGSGWNKSPLTSFHSLADWEAFLSRSVRRVRNPLKVQLK